MQATLSNFHASSFQAEVGLHGGMAAARARSTDRGGGLAALLKLTRIDEKDQDGSIVHTEMAGG